MITKSIKQHIIAYSFCGVAATALVSCNDFLDIKPMNDVVLENYWTAKADVNSVVNSCYEALEHNDALTRMGIWGELRSDNLVKGASISKDIQEILQENIESSNAYANWSKLYECINRCNTVCYYAPKVQAIDPNYTEAEMKANIAEVSTLRALAYFYLIRTFRDVPYTTTPSIDDTKSFVLPATKFDDVLDSLINDLERVKGDAVRRYQIDYVNGAYYSFPVENSSRITRNAVYALLADLYLWKGDWDNAIKCCNFVIDAKLDQYDELLKRVGDINDIDLVDSIPLILESPVGSGTTCGTTYNEIFGEGNSFESIFELYFSRNQSQKNVWVSNFYGDDSRSKGYLSANPYMLNDVFQNTNSLFQRYDGRFWESCQISGNDILITKYVVSDVSYKTDNVTKIEDMNISKLRRDEGNAPWIFYRLTDMLLIKAEALIERGHEGDYVAAFNLINTVNRRANTKKMTSTLKQESYVNSKLAMENLIMEERHREFMFEGKRWFDLVRRSLRDDNTAYLVSQVQSKFEENANAIKIKLADMNIIFMPYAKSELKVNPLLVQNPAYSNGEDSEFSK